MKSRPLIFLSHSSIDKPFVRRLAKFLQSLGFDTWLDERSIFSGDQIAEAISKGLMKARIVIIVLSRASANSRWLKYELNTILPRVVQGKCRLIPVLIEPAIIIPAALRGFNYADFDRISARDTRVCGKR